MHLSATSERTLCGRSSALPRNPSLPLRDWLEVYATEPRSHCVQCLRRARRFAAFNSFLRLADARRRTNMLPM